ncbi:hypothetical protein [Hyphomonas chukchiensis]|uniref:hypothetical protein n=1 Tax=Hyphomonas chukchiensis TaxID=1280947 RepID=UPI0012DFC204|nr:hypothetical protein [Hyphomonas chukchiensis]
MFKQINARESRNVSAARTFVGNGQMGSTIVHGEYGPLPNAAVVTARLLSNEPTFWAFDIFIQSNNNL